MKTIIELNMETGRFENTVIEFIGDKPRLVLDDVKNTVPNVSSTIDIQTRKETGFPPLFFYDYEA